MNFVNCESFLESNSPGILALSKTDLDGSIDSGVFFVMLSSFNLEGLYHPYAWPCSLWEGRTSFCMGHISRKLCRFILCFWLALLHLVSYFFSFINHLLCLCAWFLIQFHLAKMRFSLSTHLQICLSLESLTSIIRTDFPILVELIDLWELCYNFSISNDLTQMVNFPTRTPDCDFHSPALLDLFLSSDASIC